MASVFTVMVYWKGPNDNCLRVQSLLSRHRFWMTRTQQVQVMQRNQRRQSGKLRHEDALRAFDPWEVEFLGLRIHSFDANLPLL